LFPIDQLWHHCHLQQICWFPFILAILDHLEQEHVWKAATFFPATTNINAVSGKNQNYFTSSDPHHDISKQLVDTTFV